MVVFLFNVNGNDVCSYGNRYGVLIFFWYARYVAWRGVHSFSYIEKGTSSHEVFAEGTVEQLLHQYGYDDFQYMSFVGVYASFQSNKGETTIVPLIKGSEYNQEARKQNRKRIILKRYSDTRLL